MSKKFSYSDEAVANSYPRLADPRVSDKEKQFYRWKSEAHWHESDKLDSKLDKYSSKFNDNSKYSVGQLDKYFQGKLDKYSKN